MIHVVRSGESVYSIARIYGVSPARIIEDNMLSRPGRLAVGQTLVIMRPETTYTVRSGDTLAGIARLYGVSENTLYRNNPVLGGNPELSEGQTIVITYADVNRRGAGLFSNGYTYPFINNETLRQTLPFLNYITPFTYGFRPDGTLVGLDDGAIIATAGIYQTKPVMLISTLTDEGSFDNNLSHTLLADTALQDTLISNILENMRSKGYTVLEIDFEYIFPQDRDAYSAFVRRTRAAIANNGYELIVALAPKTSADQRGLLYEAHDYRALGAAADYVMLMTYEWGYTFGPPMAVAPIDKVREVVEYAASEIPSAKIILGIPNYGYDWKLPFIAGESAAMSLSNRAATELASDNSTTILFDARSMAPYFYYTDSEGNEHVVWFEDARSYQAKLDLATEYSLRGTGVWNIMQYSSQLWLVYNSEFIIPDQQRV